MSNSIKQTLSRSGLAKQKVQQTTRQIQATGEQRVHDFGVEMVTTKQDGDEDSFESTEVQRRRQPNLAMKFRWSVKRHLPAITSRRSEQEVTNNMKYGIRSAESDERRVQSR